jgi:hypothetical protein
LFGKTNEEADKKRKINCKKKFLEGFFQVGWTVSWVDGNIRYPHTFARRGRDNMLCFALHYLLDCFERTSDIAVKSEQQIYDSIINTTR